MLSLYGVKSYLDLKVINMLDLTRLYGDADVKGHQIGTLTISIPRARGFKIDRKGRKRRFTDKYELALTAGPGALNRKSLNKVLGKYQTSDKKWSTASPKLVNKLVALMMGKL